MKYLKSYLSQLIFGLFLVVVMAISFRGSVKTTLDDDYSEYNQDWICTLNNQDTSYAILPKSIKTNGSKEIILKKKLSEDIGEHSAIGFFTSHQSIYAYVDGALIYEYGIPTKSYSKTPGNGWNIIDFKNEYAGKELSIVIEASYDTEKIVVPKIYYGSIFALISNQLRKDLLPLMLSILMLIFGLILIFCWTFLRKQLHIKDGILWLGLFSSMLSVWSVLEIQIAPIFFGHNLLFNHISFVSLKLIFIPIVLFVNNTYDLKKGIVLKGLCFANIADFFISCSLQFFGILDFSETLFITHIIFVTAVVRVIYVSIKLFRNADKKKKINKRAVSTHALCIVLVALAALMDIARFYFVYSSDSAVFSRIGLLVYIVVLTILMLDDSVQLIRKGEEVETIKEVALQDVLTKMKNRNSFHKEIAKVPYEKYKDFGIAMFDLNNLKKFNDIYGHSSGDYYIIICSEVIMDIYGSFGSVYRIGGDEFCAMTYGVSLEKFLELEDEMSKRVSALNGQFYENRMAVASGFAKFDEKIDNTLNDTFERADKNMYGKKAEMKSKN